MIVQLGDTNDSVSLYRKQHSIGNEKTFHIPNDTVTESPDFSCNFGNRQMAQHGSAFIGNVMPFKPKCFHKTFVVGCDIRVMKFHSIS